MRYHRCDVCGRPATIHETSLSDGAVTDQHLCDEHGSAMLLAPATYGEQADLRALVEHYCGLSDAEKDQLALDYRLSRRLA